MDGCGGGNGSVIRARAAGTAARTEFLAALA